MDAEGIRVSIINRENKMQAMDNKNQPLTELKMMSGDDTKDLNWIRGMLGQENVDHVKITKILKEGTIPQQSPQQRHQNR